MPSVRGQPGTLSVFVLAYNLGNFLTPVGILCYAPSMAKSATIRMREYRARRRAAGLCWEGGCKEIAATYCPTHREAHRLDAVRRKVAAVVGSLPTTPSRRARH